MTDRDQDGGQRTGRRPDPPERATGHRDPARGPTAGVEDPGPGDVPEPIPEADSDATADAWEESGAMEGEAPTG